MLYRELTPEHEQYILNKLSSKDKTQETLQQELANEFGTLPRTIREWRKKLILKLSPSNTTSSEPENENTCNQEVLKLRKSITNHKDEINKLRTELKDALKEATTTSAIKKLIHGVNKDFNDLPEWLSPCDVKNEIPIFDGVPVLFISDLHFDEIVDSGEMGGVNQYNRRVATDRLTYTVDKAIDILENNINGEYDGIILALGGDQLSGIINNGNEHNEATIIESLLALSELLVQVIERLQNKFKKVFVPCVNGNHSRLQQQYKFKHKTTENYEFLLHHIVAKNFRNNSSIKFYIPDEPDAYFKVYNTKILLTHGDFIKGGGIGIAGVLTPIMRGMLKKKSVMTSINKSFDVMMIGHFHQYNILGSGSHSSSVIMNGSIKGYDEFAKGLSLPFSQPEQALFIIHPTKGITFNIPIQCNGYEEQNKVDKNEDIIKIW